MSVRRTASLVSLLVAALTLAACAAGNGPGDQGHLSLGLADSALAGGAPQIALGVARNVLAHDPRNVAALVRQGDAYHQLGDEARAAASYRDALLVSPRSVGALMGLGRLALANDPQAASARFSEVIALQPGNDMAYADRGVAADLSGLHDEAQADYRRAIAIERVGISDQLNSRLASTQVDYAVSLALSGRADAAVGLLRPIANSPDATPRVRQDFAMALVLDGRDTEAAQILGAQMSQAQSRAAIAGYLSLRPAGAPASAPSASPDGEG